ncbi:peptidylprolyl isomerase [Silvimonas amylolytica]|uniref:Periplasmic chaperone PpiD n=1 Tax=Silvimonas amylolytica TaxID=449663 RepID=A0ABQ2PHA1_9NEIS|nr:peptidylprolyl isomerase [Silvimonas amylolytica]GGP24676.1 peptidylprolyl isomerase [Silvimonas amylolytica]
MFDLVQKNKTAAQLILGVVSLGLIIGFGLSSYTAMEGGPNWLAKVGGKTITEADVAMATRGQFISDDQKPEVVQNLIRRQLILNQAQSLRLTPSAAQLRDAIAAIPAFQENGQFSPKRYQEMLASTQRTPEGFQQEVANDLASQQLVLPFAQASIASRTTVDHLIALLTEKREIAVAVLKPQDYMSQVTVSDAEVKQFYDQHQADLKAPEMVRVEYVVLSRAQLAAQQTVSDDDVQKYFDAHKSELTQSEEREASHILIQSPKTAPAADRAAAKAKAENILKEVKANPSRFAELAKSNSDDPGSKDKGGDLGWNSRGRMVKAFDDTVFSLQPGEISNVVETEFGYHIIKLDGVRGNSLADLKPQIVEKLKNDKAQSLYQTQADKFNEVVYQQADSLKPAADQFKLSVQQSGWITRKGAQDAVLNNAKLSDAIFSDDVLKKKHNSEAVEVSPGTLVSARVVEHKDAQVPPLATVAPDIQGRLKNEKAAKLVSADGAKKLAALQKGESVNVAWDAQTKEVARMSGDPSISPDRMSALFAAPANKLPAYVGGDDAPTGGYILYKVNKVLPQQEISPAMRAQLTRQIEGAYGEEALANYLKSLQDGAKIEMRAAKAKDTQ